MKRKKCEVLVLVIVLLIATFALAGCAGATSDKKNNGKLKVVTTLFAAYDFAKQVGGDLVEVSLLLKPGAEAHSFEPTPKDIVNIGECDVFICNGGENEVWVDEILDTIDNPKLMVVKMVDCCEGIEEEELEGMQEAGGVLAELFGAGHNHEPGDDHAEAENGLDDHADHEHNDLEHEGHEHDEDEVEWDEHVWMSPANAKLISEKICEAYCELDSGNSEKYVNQKNLYIEKLDAADKEIRARINQLEDKLLVFADRFPARYFVEEYGLEYRAAFSGCSANTQASAATVAFIIDLVRNRNVDKVFTIELSDGRLAAAVAEETGARVETFYTGHNVTLEDFDSGVTYIGLLYRNLKAITEK